MLTVKVRWSSGTVTHQGWVVLTLWRERESQAGQWWRQKAGKKSSFVAVSLTFWSTGYSLWFQTLSGQNHGPNPCGKNLSILAPETLEARSVNHCVMTNRHWDLHYCPASGRNAWDQKHCGFEFEPVNLLSVKQTNASMAGQPRNKQTTKSDWLQRVTDYKEWQTQ